MRHHIVALRDVATKRLIKQFTTKHQLVYFGNVNAHDDEHELVRGITASTTHVDSNYAVGTFQGHDITFVQRRNTLTFPGKPESSYKWLIISIDLKRSDLPHVFIDANHHDTTFYANLAIGFAKLQQLPHPLPGIEHGARVLAPLDQVHKVQAILPPQVASTLTHNFKHLDYEFHDDQLYVYASNLHTTPVLLNDMLRVGLWLANHINALPAL